jgi:hypothetical protein
VVAPARRNENARKRAKSCDHDHARIEARAIVHHAGAQIFAVS